MNGEQLCFTEEIIQRIITDGRIGVHYTNDGRVKPEIKKVVNYIESEVAVPSFNGAESDIDFMTDMVKGIIIGANDKEVQGFIKGIHYSISRSYKFFYRLYKDNVKNYTDYCDNLHEMIDFINHKMHDEPYYRE